MSSNPFESPVSDGGYQAPVRTTKTLKSIDLLQAGKVFGMVYVLFGLIALPFVVLAAFFTDDAGAGGYLVGMVVGATLAYGVLGFLGGALMAFLYNVVAKMSGGLRFDFE